MAKITTVIDIGSNSCRMIILEKSSHFAFHLLKEIKSRVRISEGAYEHDGFLQDIPKQRCIDALDSFLSISKSYKSKKILCVATSAVRDAPNGKEFVNEVRKKLGLNIKIISGEKEAYFGGIAISNLLYLENATGIDIGGGSTEFIAIKDRKIIDTVSLNIGTVRLKELFSNDGLQKAKDFIIKQLDSLPSHFNNDNIIGIGGSARALSKLLVSADYPIENIHGFSYDVDALYELTNNIINSTDEDLTSMGIKKDRLDIIKEGALIFSTIIEYLGARYITTSGVGVREGVYLSDLLRNYNGMFPSNFDLSVRSLCDRFMHNEKVANYNQSLSSKLFDVLKSYHNLDDKFRKYLNNAVKLCDIGDYLGFYHRDKHTSYFIINNLHYGFSHAQRIFIASLVYNKKKVVKTKNIDYCEELNICEDGVQKLRFILTLTNLLNSDNSNAKFDFSFANDTLSISSNKNLYLVKSGIDKVNKIDQNLQISFDT
jgi:exopolyphosphatase/guanosine-5'-triphosphate,3'-diphosphate pyrophosphatase